MPDDTVMLSDVAQIRRRPGMYAGDVHDGSGLHHLLWELVSNCVDEHLAGFAHRVIVTLHDDDSVTVEDDGRGIPIDRGESTLPFVEVALTRTHSTGTFDGHKKHVHLGLHGVGLSAVNALASTLVVEIARAGKLHRQSYREGIPTAPLAVVGESTTTGTRITYAPDPTIFTVRSFDHDLVRRRLHEVACFNPQLLVRFIDKRTDFVCPTGILELASRLGRGPEIWLWNAPKLPVAPIYVRGQQDEIGVEVALHWTLWSGRGEVRSFVNQQETREGGTHVTGVRRACSALLREVRASDRRKLAVRLHRRAVGIICVTHHDPRYDSPTKSKLGSPEVRPIVERVVKTAVKAFAEKHPDDVARLIESVRHER